MGNEWALEEAKRNLQKHYLLVGVTEELSDFILTLQVVLPRFFKGAYDVFMHSKSIIQIIKKKVCRLIDELIFFIDNKSHLRQTTQKIDPLPETIKKIQKSVVWKMENELYNYALSQFHAVKKRLINASMQDANQRFFYEKIRPK